MDTRKQGYSHIQIAVAHTRGAAFVTANLNRSCDNGEIVLEHIGKIVDAPEVSGYAALYLGQAYLRDENRKIVYFCTREAAAEALAEHATAV